MGEGTTRCWAVATTTPERPDRAIWHGEVGEYARISEEVAAGGDGAGGADACDGREPDHRQF